MKIYCLSHGDYEEYLPFLVSHDNKTEEQWNHDVIAAMSIAAENILSTIKDEWIGSCEITKAAVDILIKSGYKKVETVEIVMRGSDIIKNDNDIDYQINESTKKRIFEHNINFEKELNKDIGVIK